LSHQFPVDAAFEVGLDAVTEVITVVEMLDVTVVVLVVGWVVVDPEVGVVEVAQEAKTRDVSIRMVSGIQIASLFIISSFYSAENIRKPSVIYLVELMYKVESLNSYPIDIHISICYCIRYRII
jgi:hypothetical protein